MRATVSTCFTILTFSMIFLIPVLAMSMNSVVDSKCLITYYENSKLRNLRQMNPYLY
jgi:hypothetical protein